MLIKNSKVVFLLVLLSVLHLACTADDPPSKPIVSLDPVKSVSAINDSIFTVNVGSMNSANGRIVFSTYLGDGKSQIIQLNPNLELESLIQRNGKGPGEFTSVTDIGLANDSLYVYSSTQAKLLVFDINNRFIRETRLRVASITHIAVDSQSQIFFSTPGRGKPITKFSAGGQPVATFGRNTIGEESMHYRRNMRILFLHGDRLIAVGRSEPVLELYDLEGTFIREARIDPPEIRDQIVHTREANDGPDARGFSILFNDAAIHNDTLYLLVAKHRDKRTMNYDSTFTYLLAYRLNPDGGITHMQTFKLFRADREKLMYGSGLTVAGDHKMVVYDMMGKQLLLYEDKRL